MTYVVTKIIKGNPYLYEVKSVRVGDRVVQQFVRYLGRADKSGREELGVESVERKERIRRPAVAVSEAVAPTVAVETETPAPVEPTPPIEKVTAPVTKEPWQMTKAERATYIEQKGKESIQKWNESGGKGFPPSNPERWGVSEVNKAADELGMPWGEGRVAIPQHKYEVMVALKQGKPIPPEVLKDYPDLAPKPTPEVMVTPIEPEITPINPYMNMPIERVRRDAQHGVKLAKEALATREESTPEVTPAPEVERKLGFREWQWKYGKNISDELDEKAWRRYYFKEPAIPKAEGVTPTAPAVEPKEKPTGVTPSDIVEFSQIKSPKEYQDWIQRQNVDMPYANFLRDIGKITEDPRYNYKKNDEVWLNEVGRNQIIKKAVQAYDFGIIDKAELQGFIDEFYERQELTIDELIGYHKGTYKPSAIPQADKPMNTEEMNTIMDEYFAVKSPATPTVEPITPEVKVQLPTPEEIQWRFPTADDFYFWARRNNLGEQQTNQLWQEAKEAKKILQGKKPPEPVTPTAPATPEVTKKEGSLIAKYTETKMSPETGLDTEYSTEYRVIEAPEYAGAEWMGNPYGVIRIFTKGGVEVDKDLLEVGMSPEAVVKALPFETSYKKAEKFGLAKTEYEKYERGLADKEQAKQAKEREEQAGYKRYQEAVANLGSIKGVKKTDISYFSPVDNTQKTREGFDVGNGVGIVVHEMGGGKEYAVTHINTGLAMGHNWKNRAEAVALAKSVAKITDWSKYSNEKEIPQEIMSEAASLVRGFTSKSLQPVEVTQPEVPEAEVIPTEEVSAPKVIPEAEKPYKPPEMLSYGLPTKRAIELGEDPQYPRMAAAVFHFDELTPDEQNAVIAGKKQELADALQERKVIYQGAKEFGKSNKEMGIKPDLNPYPYRKRQNAETIDRLQKQIQMFNEKIKHSMSTEPTPSIQELQYSRDLDIRNIEALPKGTGAKYLITLKGQGDELIAKQWARVKPASLKPDEVLVSMTPPVAEGKRILSEAITLKPETPTATFGQNITKAVEERPTRISHGNTAKNAFYVTKDNRIIPADEFSQVSRGDDIISVHSHSGENWEQYTREHGQESFQPPNAADFDHLRWLVKQGYGNKIAVIMGDGRYIQVEIPESAQPRFTRMGRKTLEKLLYPESRGASDAEHLAKLKQAAKEEGWLLTEGDWKD